MVRTHMSQYHSPSLYALSLNSLTDAYGRIHSLPSLLMGSTFGNDVLIWQTESWWGGGVESNEEMAPLWSRTQYLEL